MLAHRVNRGTHVSGRVPEVWEGPIQVRTPCVIRRASAILLTAVTALAVVIGTAGVAGADSLGVDVSSWQHKRALNWSRVKAHHNSFAFIKATEGTGYVNPYFSRDWRRTKQVGIFHGAYHFATPHRGNAKAQARFFVRVAGRMHHHGVLPPVLDLEVTGGLRPKALQRWTRTWLETVHGATGRKPIVYTSPVFWRTALGNTRQFSDYPLWIAHYGVSRPHVPGGWRTWTFWQGRSNGRVPGIGGGVDRNAFNGSYAKLRRLAHAGTRVRHHGGHHAQHAHHKGHRHRGKHAHHQLHRHHGEHGHHQLHRHHGGHVHHSRHHGQHGHHDRHRHHSGHRHHRTGVALRLQAAAGSVASGHLVKLYGHLTTAAGRPLPARRVRIYRRPVSSDTWTRIDIAKSVAPTGWYQTYVHPRKASLYRAVFRGGRRYQHTGSLRVRVRMQPPQVSRLAAAIRPVG